MRMYHRARAVFFGVFIGAIVLATILYFLDADKFSLGKLILFIDSFGIWAPISFIILYVVVSIFLPTTPLMALAGAVFGFKYGILYTTTGGLISSIITFQIARILGRPEVEELLTSNRLLSSLNKYDNKLESHGILTTIILRLLPVMPFNMLNIFMGISSVKRKDYMLGTLLGLLPSNLISVYFGSSIIYLIRLFSGYLGL